MSNDEKNKVKYNMWFKQGAFVLLAALWVLAILFKNQMSGTVRAIVFVVMILLSVGCVYWINKSFFGISKDNQDKK